MKHLFAAASLALLTAAPALAGSIDILSPTPTSSPPVAYEIDVASLGLSSVAYVEFEDGPVGVGGTNNAGFDIDAIILDGDGDLLTVGDQTTAASYDFFAGTSGGATLFGTTASGEIDFSFATLDVFDGVPGSTPSGFLSMGEGGILRANFAPSVPVGGSLFIFTADVGGRDFLSRITVSDMPAAVPLPAGGLLLTSAVATLALRRRKG